LIWGTEAGKSMIEKCAELFHVGAGNFPDRYESDTLRGNHELQLPVNRYTVARAKEVRTGS